MKADSQAYQIREYQSVISNWDSRSAVRTKPRRMLSQEDRDRVFFSRGLTPAASHPLVLSRGRDYSQDLLTRRLYSYLDFTTILEQEIVNPVVLRLSRDAFGLDLPDSVRFDAFRIYCDEAYHALFSADMKKQVEECTGRVSVRGAEPGFARVIRNAKNSLPPDLGGLVEFCATVVSETLISGSLTRIPQDETVVSFVRETIADHASDERTHHAYFTKIFEIAWPQIDRKTQMLLSPYFGDFILAFLAPDCDGQRDALWRMGFTREAAAQIVWESHPADATVTDARFAARSTLRLLEKSGVLNYSRTNQYFHELGLLVADSIAPDVA